MANDTTSWGPACVGSTAEVPPGADYVNVRVDRDGCVVASIRHSLKSGLTHASHFEYTPDWFRCYQQDPVYPGTYLIRIGKSTISTLAHWDGSKWDRYVHPDGSTLGEIANHALTGDTWCGLSLERAQRYGTYVEAA